MRATGCAARDAKMAVRLRFCSTGCPRIGPAQLEEASSSSSTLAVGASPTQIHAASQSYPPSPGRSPATSATSTSPGWSGPINGGRKRPSHHHGPSREHALQRQLLQQEWRSLPVSHNSLTAFVGVFINSSTSPSVRLLFLIPRTQRNGRTVFVCDGRERSQIAAGVCAGVWRGLASCARACLDDDADEQVNPETIPRDLVAGYLASSSTRAPSPQVRAIRRCLGCDGSAAYKSLACSISVGDRRQTEHV